RRHAEPPRRRAEYRYASAASAPGTVSFGLTPYHVAAILPFSSIRKAERTMPMYLRPYIDFSPHTPKASATVWSSSASRGKPSEYLVSNFCCAAGLSGLMPITSTPCAPKSRRASRTLHDCTVHPGVSALG